jgi:hypothetical protein
LNQGRLLIGALETKQEVTELELGGVLEGGVVEVILILLPPLNEGGMVLSVFRIFKCSNMELDRGRS